MRDLFSYFRVEDDLWQTFEVSCVENGESSQVLTVVVALHSSKSNG
jgi:hypothetical protein